MYVLKLVSTTISTRMLKINSFALPVPLRWQRNLCTAPALNFHTHTCVSCQPEKPPWKARTVRRRKGLCKYLYEHFFPPCGVGGLHRRSWLCCVDCVWCTKTSKRLPRALDGNVGIFWAEEKISTNFPFLRCETHAVNLHQTLLKISVVVVEASLKQSKQLQLWIISQIFA